MSTVSNATIFFCVFTAVFEGFLFSGIVIILTYTVVSVCMHLYVIYVNVLEED